ncbi:MULTISPECIES: hypothetical protein [Okeania]|uniref:hypothetical protein n=1 Tax=Okeania TaxID=1458928 RepID=UPI001375350B|nr:MULTISPECIES: hypothetical protein [Okeania]NET78027.1 hypothetical protein [Okeania sp. SIO1F9]
MNNPSIYLKEEERSQKEEGRRKKEEGRRKQRRRKQGRRKQGKNGWVLKLLLEWQ